MSNPGLPAPDPQNLKWGPWAPLQTGEPWGLPAFQVPASLQAPQVARSPMAHLLAESSTAEAELFRQWILKGSLEGAFSSSVAVTLANGIPYLKCEAKITSQRAQNIPIGQVHFDHRLNQKIFISPGM